MRLDYSLSPADLREAARPTRADGRPTRRPLARGILGWVVFLAMGLLLLYLKTLPKPAPAGLHDPLRPPDPPEQNLWVTLLPSLTPAVFIVLVVVATVAVRPMRARQVAAALVAGRPVPPPSTGRVLGAMIGLALGAVLVAPLLLGDAPAAAIPWHPTPGVALWVGFAPWIVALGVLLATLAWAARRSADWQWAVTPALHRRLSADVSDAGVRTTDGVIDTLYRWPAFTRYRETDHLLVLTLEDARVLVLPKRAVPDAEDALRGLIQTHVADGSFLPRSAAFPVLAAAAR